MFLNKNGTRLFKILIIIGGLCVATYGLIPFIQVRILNSQLDHWHDEYTNPFQDRLQVQNVELKIEANAVDPRECEISFIAYVKTSEQKDNIGKDREKFLYEAVRPRLAEGCATKGFYRVPFIPQYKKVADFKAEFLSLGSVTKEERKDVAHEIFNKAIIMAAYAPNPSMCRATGLAILQLLSEDHIGLYDALYVADDKIKESCLPGKE